MRSPLGAALGAAALVLATAGIGFTLAMRHKWPPLQDRIRRMNKRVMNPRQIASGAGGPGSWAALVHHVGRTSGRSYTTPVVAVPTDGGFWIALPYGTRADWVRNVLAAGGAAITHDGQTHRVDRPEVGPPTDVAWVERLFGVDQVLHVRQVGGAAPDVPSTTLA